MRRGERRLARSTRGHVRVDEKGDWPRWAAIAAAALVLVIAGALVMSEIVAPALKSRGEISRSSRTWFEFDPWAALPDGVASAGQVVERLRENGIGTVYLEAAAWLSDGAVREGDHAAAFVQALREGYPGLRVLLWLRMSNDQIADATRRERAADLAQKAVFDWGFDGVQLQGYAVPNNSESYVQLVRKLRETIGADSILSLAGPPDRIPTDPAVPIGMAVAPELTWDVNFKQRIGLLLVDEIVIMAYAAGLPDGAAYEKWVAYQIESYAEALDGLEPRPRLAVAIPTYDAAPGHDPAIESVRAAATGIERGRKRLGTEAAFDGVGVYIYSATDSREWAVYREAWLGLE